MWKTVSTEGKLDVITWLERGERIVGICCNIRLTDGNVCTVCDNADRVKECVKTGMKVGAKRTYSRSSTTEYMEKMLSTWTKGWL